MKKFFVFIILFFTLFPLTVYADDELEEGLSETELLEAIEVSATVDEIPNINARHAIVIERNSKQILYGKNETEKCKMASTTKIMSSLIVIENCSLSDTVTISSKAANTGGSRLGLSTNDQITVENLLYGLMLRSGNDAAVALAEHTAGSVEGFVELMNQKAIELGLSSTHFVTPHGLDSDEHYTTAYDLALLTDYALQNETFAKIVNTKTYTITLNGYSKTLNNTNELLGNFVGVYGVKTGFTNGANRCLVTACKRDNLDVICVVLGCDTKKDRTSDSMSLLNYIFNNFTVVNIEDIIDKNFEDWNLLHKNSFTINKGVSQFLDLFLDKSELPYSSVAIKKSDLDKINTNIVFTSYHEAPIFTNTVVGNLEFKVDDTKYSNTIFKKNVIDYLSSLLANYCDYFYLSSN
jgi:D-alanyl-D-alanine carboxypeptidase (penicillin-binding protein 5/6)